MNTVHFYTLQKRKPLELINKFTKVAGYKINTQKPVVFLYTRNELSEER